jgi:peptide/nickel transport system substrate-binding protein
LGGTEWYNWYESKGEAGDEPPEIVQTLYDLVDQWLAEPRGSEKYLSLGAEILKINAENVWCIGTIGLVPRVTVLTDDLRNVPEPGTMVSIEHGMWRPHIPAQWWLAQ